MARKDGLLDEDQIRGIDPNYRYQYKGYPKALYPPKVTVTDVAHEKRLRSQWNQPLPWTNPQQQKARDEYYAMQIYPKDMHPPHVTVQNPDEEQAMLASWGVTKASSHSEVWPHYMFHAKQGGRLVRSLVELQSMGEGWHDTPDQAMEAAAGIIARKPAPVAGPKAKMAKPMAVRSVLEPEVTADTASDPDSMNRIQMFAFLKARGIKASLPISNDELRARVKTTLSASDAVAA